MNSTRIGRPTLCGRCSTSAERFDSKSPEQVTHLITVSCTGFFNPGPGITRSSDRCPNPTVQRFSHRYGVLWCLSRPTSGSIDCQADPEACVLIAMSSCAHSFAIKDDLNSILGGALLLADGAAAVLVNSRPQRPDKTALETGITSPQPCFPIVRRDGLDHGDHGFDDDPFPQVRD